MAQSRIKLALGQMISSSPTLWRLCVRLYNKRARFRGFQGEHPIDRAYGVDTAGAIPPWLLGSGSASDPHVSPYVGCQPSCLRAALSFLGDDVDGATFVDLGCGKGRAMLVASEYPFHAIVGVEMSPGLCEVARRNLAAVRARGSLPKTLSVTCGDAIGFQYPPGALVIFFYQSFGLPVLRRALDAIEAIDAHEHLYFVYENPVHGEELDRRQTFERWFARTVPADADELPFHTGLGAPGRDTIVVWRHSGHQRVGANRDARRSIVIEADETRAAPL